MASNLLAMASNLRAMASNLLAMASNLLVFLLVFVACPKFMSFPVLALDLFRGSRRSILWNGVPPRQAQSFYGIDIYRRGGVSTTDTCRGAGVNFVRGAAYFSSGW